MNKSRVFRWFAIGLASVVVWFAIPVYVVTPCLAKFTYAVPF